MIDFNFPAMVTKTVVYDLLTGGAHPVTSLVIIVTYRHIARIINFGNAAEILGGRYGSFKLLDEAQVNSPTKVLMSKVNKLLRIYYTLCYS